MQAVNDTVFEFLQNFSTRLWLAAQHSTTHINFLLTWRRFPFSAVTWL